MSRVYGRKAMELGALRYSQGFDAYEILKEYEILGGILFTHLGAEAESISEPCTTRELLACAQRLFYAIALIQQTTTTHFLRLAADQVHEREERLRAFNRVLSHEIKNRIGTILGAGDMLNERIEMPPGDRKLLEIVRRNARSMHSAVENVLSVGPSGNDARQQRNVPLRSAVRKPRDKSVMRPMPRVSTFA